MLPAIHLLIGITLGIFLLYLTKDCRALIYSAFGSLLPDIIDKPVGHIILANLGNGRIFFHSLIVCALVAFIGLILLKKWRHPGLLYIAAGVLSHQLADAMWAEPRSWCWPFYGWFDAKYNPDYFTNIFAIEFSAPSELLVIAGAAVLIVCFLQAWRTGNTRIFQRAVGFFGILLLAAGAIVLSGNACGLLPGFLVYSGVRDCAICGLALLCGGAAFLFVWLSPPPGCAAKKWL